MELGGNMREVVVIINNVEALPFLFVVLETFHMWGIKERKTGCTMAMRSCPRNLERLGERFFAFTVGFILPVGDDDRASWPRVAGGWAYGADGDLRCWGPPFTYAAILAPQEHPNNPFSGRQPFLINFE